MKTTAAALAFLLTVSVRASAAKPTGEAWKGFTLTLPSAEAGKDPDKALVYYNTEIHGDAGSVELRPQGATKTEQFKYENSFKLWALTRLEDAAGTALFYKKATPFTLYVHVDAKDAAKNRFVVRSEGGPQVLADAKSIKDLGTKTLVENEAAAKNPIKDPTLVVVRDAPPPEEKPKPPVVVKDEVSDAIDKLCEGKTCTKSELVFFKKALRDAPNMAEGEDKKRLMAIRERVKLEASGGSQDDPVSINMLRRDNYVAQSMGNQILNPDASISSQLSNDELMDDFCPKLKSFGLSGGRAFKQAQALDHAGSVATTQPKPEDIKGANGWEKTNLDNIQAKCDERARQRTGVVRNGEQKQDGTVDQGGQQQEQNPTGNGTFTVKKDVPEPEEKKVTNPYKNQIMGAKFGIWAGLLGFIFGGPAGAVLFGLAGAAAGYYISSYK